MTNKTKNLKSIRSVNEAREKGKKGGIKSGEARREKKKLRQLLEMALEMREENADETNAMAITVALIKQAKKGNVLAYTTIRDTIGEKPTDKQEITGKDGEPLGERIIYVTPEEQAEVKAHIRKMIGEY